MRVGTECEGLAPRDAPQEDCPSLLNHARLRACSIWRELRPQYLVVYSEKHDEYALFIPAQGAALEPLKRTKEGQRHLSLDLEIRGLLYRSKDGSQDADSEIVSRSPFFPSAVMSQDATWHVVSFR
jgi:hypothetical protein